MVPAKQERGETKLPTLIDEICGKLEVAEAAESEDLGIYKVPSKLRKLKEDAYNPRVISIGPFHQTNPDLAAMRKHKWRHMLSFVQQTDDFNVSLHCLKALTDAIYGKDDKVRRCYAEEIEQDKNDLTEMMLLDGCFILELFLRHWRDLKYKKEEDGPDPILERSWMTASLRHDLALLENQIPFFILEDLYDTILPFVSMIRPPLKVASLALAFFKPSLLSPRPIEDQVGEIKCKHLLDLLYKFCFFEIPAPGHSVTVISIDNADSASDTGRRSDGTDAPPKQETSSSCFLLSGTKASRNCDISVEIEMITEKSHHSRPEPVFSSVKQWGFKYCASELFKSGIEFEKMQRTDHLLNITSSRGVIKIPPISIDDLHLWNIIAFEQCSLGSLHHMTSYAVLLKSLIRYPRDIKLLKQTGIISSNWIREEEYLSQLQSILDEVVVKEFYFGDLCDRVNAYHGKFGIRRGIKYIYRNYFSKAWSMISVVAAIILFILTALQTFFTVRPR